MLPTNKRDNMTEYLDLTKWQVASALSEAASAKLETAIAPEDFMRALERPPEHQMGDYACPCFRFARTVGKKPPEIALLLSQGLEESGGEWVAKADVAGAFLNIHVNLAKYSQVLLQDIETGDYFKRAQMIAGSAPQKVMIEYSQPNTHKAFHVGHMRNVALGDSLGRLYEYCGYPVVMANYIGDEGTHIAKCIWYMKRQQAVAPDSRRGEWLGEMYARACIELEDAPKEEQQQFQDEVSAILRQIESKQGDAYAFWQESRQWSIDDFKEIYEWVDARFDHWFCESEVSEESQQIVDEYLTKGVFVEDDGAIGLDLKNDKLGFVLLRKRDGNTLYATKDLALARRKYAEFNIEKSIYVVGSEQNLHFKQVFKTLDKMGFKQAKDCYHLSYGMVVLPDGKMSSRKGNQIIFRQLKESLEAEMGRKLERYQGEWSSEKLAAVNRLLCVGAIRYGMVCSDPVKDLVFSLPDWLSFEGNTGPYLMYAFARTQSILAKGAEQGYFPNFDATSLFIHEDERELIRYMNDLNVAVKNACETSRHSVLAHHLFDMGKVYSRMLANVKVLNLEDKAISEARLALLSSFAKILKQGLYILGITPPERM